MNESKTLRMLESFGLSEKQAATYLASLQLGTANIRNLSLRSGLQRTTLYEIVDQLVAQGLLLSEGSGWGKRYTAVDPKQLELILERKREALESALPDLSKLYSLGAHESSVRQAQGKSAIRRAYRAILDEVEFHEWYLVLTDLARWTALDPEFLPEFARKRSGKVRNTRILSTPCPEAKIRATKQEAIRILPAKMDIPINLVITPQQVLLHQMLPPENALIITGSQVISIHRQIFELVWSLSSPPR